MLTGNVRPLAEVKLAPLGLTEHLDLDVGAYGDEHEVRAELVHLARQRAALAYGDDFGGEATVIVGDTPLDIGPAWPPAPGRSASPLASSPSTS